MRIDTPWGIVASTEQAEEIRMSVVTIDRTACDRSPGCPAKRVCPRGAIVPVDGFARNGYTVREDLCTGCGVCIRACPGRAVRVA